MTSFDGRLSECLKHLSALETKPDGTCGTCGRTTGQGVTRHPLEDVSRVGAVLPCCGRLRLVLSPYVSSPWFFCPLTYHHTKVIFCSHLWIRKLLLPSLSCFLMDCYLEILMVNGVTQASLLLLWNSVHEFEPEASFLSFLALGYVWCKLTK